MKTINLCARVPMVVMVLVCGFTRKFSLTVSGVLLQTSNQFCGGESVCVPPQFLVCPALQALRLAKVTITQLSSYYNGHHIFQFLLSLPKKHKEKEILLYTNFDINSRWPDEWAFERGEDCQEFRGTVPPSPEAVRGTSGFHDCHTPLHFRWEPLLEETDIWEGGTFSQIRK